MYQPELNWCGRLLLIAWLGGQLSRKRASWKNKTFYLTVEMFLSICMQYTHVYRKILALAEKA